MGYRLRVIGILLLTGCVGLFAKSKDKAVMTVDQEQQFLYYFYAAQQAMDQQNYPSAYTLLDFCHQINPSDTTVTVYLAKQQLDDLLDKEQWKQALKLQDEVDQLSGFDANSALNRYRIYIGLGKGKQAVAEIDRYLEKDPESLNFLLFRADIHAHLGEDQQVFELSRRIAKLLPLSFVEYEQIKIVPYCAYYVSHLVTYDADSLMSIGQRDQAYMFYEIAMYLWPKNLTAINNYAYGMATHGGDLSRAEKMSATTIQAEPDNAVFLDTYAWILYLKGQNSLAEFYLKKALEKARRDEVKEVIVEHLKEVKGEK